MTPKQSIQVTDVRVTQFIRSRFNPTRGITPEILSTQLDAWDAGWISQLALIMETVEDRDPIIKTVAGKRKKAVIRYPWEILTIDDSAEAQKHKDALLYFYNNAECVNAINDNERGSVKLLVRQMMDAVGKGYAVHEIVWQPVGNGELTAQFRFVPLWFFESTTGKLRYLTSEGMLYGVPMEDGAWMVTHGDGLMRATSVAWMFKKLVSDDWMAYCEKFGLPGVVVKTNASKGSEQWEEAKAAAENFGSEFAAVFSATDEVNLIEAKNAGVNPFEAVYERKQREIAALWRGADLSTMSQGKSDSSGASLQGDESMLLEQEDADKISETLNNQVDTYVIRYLFGDAVKPMAYFKIRIPDKKNVDQEIRTDEFLVKHGVQLSIQEAAERYGRAQADAGEPILTAPAVPSMVPPGQPGLPNTAEEYRDAVAADLKPWIDRIETIMRIEDGDEFSKALREFQVDLDKLKLTGSAAGELEKALQRALLKEVKK
jgi:phage gp29-like protein